MRLTKVTSRQMRVYVNDMCATSGGKIALLIAPPGGKIQLCDRTGKSDITRSDPYDCGSKYKQICELVANRYLAELCCDCFEIKVYAINYIYIYSAYVSVHGSPLALCRGGEGVLLLHDHENKAVIQLRWNEENKELDEIRQIPVPFSAAIHMCYMPNTDLLIVSHGYDVVEAVKLQGGAGQSPVWQLQGKVLGKKIDPEGVSCDSAGKVYVADGRNNRVLDSKESTLTLYNLTEG